MCSVSFRFTPSPYPYPLYRSLHHLAVISMAEVSGSGDAEHRVQAEDNERKIGRQQLVGGDKVETHKPTYSPTPTFYLMTRTDTYI